MSTYCTGNQLAIGDRIAFLNSVYTVTRFDPHPGLDGDSARVAVYEDSRGRECGITVFDAELLRLTDGVWQTV